MKTFLSSLFVGLVTFVWASIYWLNNIQFSTSLTSLDMPRPFVYRVLVPFLARSLNYLGIRIDWTVCLVVTFFGVCFYLSLRKLYFYYYSQTDKGEIYVLVSVFVGMILLGQERWIYDLATVTFFTLGIYYIRSVQNWKYLIVFTLAVLNRETSFLLVLVYIVTHLHLSYRFGWKFPWWMTACQIYIYGLITYCIRLMFSHNEGSPVWITPIENLQKYITHPFQTLLSSGIIFMISSIVGADFSFSYSSTTASQFANSCVQTGRPRTDSIA